MVTPHPGPRHSPPTGPGVEPSTATINAVARAAGMIQRSAPRRLGDPPPLTWDDAVAIAWALNAVAA